MPYQKMLRWQKINLDNPLPYNLVVACIHELKADPKEFYSEKYDSIYSLQLFEEACKSPNLYSGKAEVMKAEFLNVAGVSVESLVSSEIWAEILNCDSISDYLEKRTFSTKDQIKNLCKRIFNEYLEDKSFLDVKTFVKIYKMRGYMYQKQMENLCRGIDNLEKWAEGTSNQLWFGTYAIKGRTDAFNKLMKCEQSDELYKRAVIAIKENFNFNDLQIEMLKYAICQSKEMNCPASLNKAVYIWGAGKGTGKTTISATIVSILNGEKDHFNIRQYKSTLPQELGFADHVAPLICSSRAVLLDEAMPKDSSKSYDTFKDRITSDGAKIRFVYKNQIDVFAKANYWLSSNHPLTAFVQDKSERRFFEIEIKSKFKKLTYSEIYNIFLQFIQQCKRTKDWQKWYDEMSSDTEVKGIESQNAEDYNSYFSTQSFCNEIQMLPAQISIGTFYSHIAKFEKVFSKQLARECVIKLFGDPYRPSIWRKSDVVAGLARMSEHNESELQFTDDEENPF